jgi:hypothetical protein
MQKPCRPLRRRRRMVAPRPFWRAKPRNNNTRAAVASLANAPSTSVRSNTAAAGIPRENARLADSGASLAPPITLILVLAFWTLRIGFAAGIPFSIDEASAVLLIAAWAVIPILLGSEPIGVGSKLRNLLGMSIVGGLLISQMLIVGSPAE